MLSEEEKKAIAYFKFYIERDVMYEDTHYEQIKTILDLIEKQQEELNKEKEKNRQGKMRIIQLENEITARIEDINNDFISKDKLKEILGIDEDIDVEKLLLYIDLLVSENNRLEDIEDKKVQIEYNNVFNKGVRSVEDKIKAKIEKLNDEMLNENNSLELFYRKKYCKEVLQELLGE